MKANIIKLLMLSLTMTVTLSSCEDYLNEKPKGQNIPETTQDFYEMLNAEINNLHKFYITQAAYLLNDQRCSPSYLSWYPLYNANYMWDTSIDRAKENDSDEDVYYYGYAAIAATNVVLDYTPDSKGGSQEFKNEIMAYAKVLRAMHFYQLTNYYANAYKPETADKELAIPLVLSSQVNVAYKQGTLAEVYKQIVDDVNEALPSLGNEGRHILLPGKTACYAFLARVYLTMMDYANAEKYADMALQGKSTLFDWVAYYNENRTAIETDGNWAALSTPMDFNYCENYIFKYGNTNSLSLPAWRLERVEVGDAKFGSMWKYRPGSSYDYLIAFATGNNNYGGYKTVEQHLIKAECLARKGQIAEAMNKLDEVRKTRILPEVYQKLEASNEGEALGAIYRTKWNELIGSIVPFADIRRVNAEGKYPYTLTRTRDGQQESLAPDSYLWTMVFPLGAIENPGGGRIEYIATK